MLEGDGHRTNIHLESFNRTLNSLVGTKPNVWGVLENFVLIKADSRRVILNNAVGKDMHVNTGRKKKSLDHTEELQLLVRSFGTCPDQEYIQKIAQLRTPSLASRNVCGKLRIQFRTRTFKSVDS